MNKIVVEPGSMRADEKFHITVKSEGPYLVFGRPPLVQQFIIQNAEGESWAFQAGRSFAMADEPTALCRCGASHRKPYCDGSHRNADWDPQLTDPGDPILAGAEMNEGPQAVLSDNPHYCVFARFCDAGDRAWNLVQESDDPEKAELLIREANHCPGARLSAWDAAGEIPEEPKFEPSLGLIEDPKIDASGGLWVRGGIPIQREDGFTYEIRNRTVLCRCGQSSNKPYCDGTHASAHFDDGLGGRPEGKKW